MGKGAGDSLYHGGLHDIQKSFVKCCERHWACIYWPPVTHIVIPFKWKITLATFLVLSWKRSVIQGLHCGQVF